MNLLFNKKLLCVLLVWSATCSLAEPAQVDLRYAVRHGRQVRVIPEPGRQLGKDCVGWAVAYAAKSFQESLDQGWLPDHPSRQFSPAFIYNLVNGGIDQGGSTRAALQVVVDWGCATLATMPASGDPTRQPSSAAFEEAREFRASGYRSLRTGREIKQALSEGHAVVIVVRTNPVFISGIYPSYTRALDLQGVQAADPAAPHATHSMCVVGYDDARSAFLVMNSWGTEWRGWDGENAGMVWIDYDLMHEVGPRQEQFAKEAFVLIDIRHRAERNETSPVARGALFLDQTDRYWGFQGGRRFWEWTVFLGGDPEIRAAIAQVTYHLHPSFPDPDRVVYGAPDLRFAHTACGWGTFPLRATVLFRDGTSRQLSTHLRFASPIRE